ncbi:sequestosome-1-like isoform X2 [Trichoplusia ni]|uniref:Sequestosome-1-like isoform X2 n=1 Tax=Trichoplusia ni TaxID=7111 RepID=A0A7E5VSV1_TRINI|nr:sequestosome-1-like isoform X2 [Trichoplusia ni]
MEDQVPFKVFTFWSENEKPEVRRFGVEKTVVTSFHYLNAKLQDVYPALKGKTYSVAWKDEEGDDVIVSSDEEVMTALQALNGEVIKLYVYCKREELKSESHNLYFTVTGDDPAPETAANVHFGVMCDSCDNVIAGFRYKCTTCHDFDLCSGCEAAGHHPEHCMVRVPTPAMPRAIIREAIKRSRHFLKTVAHTMAEECPYKKSRAEKSAERRYRGQHASAGPHGGERAEHAGHGGHGGHRDHHHRRHRVSWLDTFATYMNEFANLAGDVNIDDGKPKAQEASTSAKQARNPQESQVKTEPGTAPAQAPQQPDANACGQGQATPLLSVNFEQIRDLLESYLTGNVNANMPQPPQASAPTPAPTPAANTADSTTAAPTWCPEMGQGDSKKQDDDITMHTATSTSSAGSLNGNTRDLSPDKADDWTVINKEKDMMDATNAEPAAPIGFNLPEEFQERVKISDGAIYPPLNPATAVAEVPTAATAPPAAAAAPTPAEKPAAAAAQPRQRHPHPHIDAAIQQMLMMGFTNEGGWLTQLLESKDGNIAAVLDLLTPVKK